MCDPEHKQEIKYTKSNSLLYTPYSYDLLMVELHRPFDQNGPLQCTI